MLTQRLQVYAYSDATLDQNVESPSYTYTSTVWGRIIPLGQATDKTIATTERAERSATILIRDTAKVPDGAIVLDPLTGDQWRIAGGDRLPLLRLIRYAGEFVPNIPLTVSVGTGA